MDGASREGECSSAARTESALVLELVVAVGQRGVLRRQQGLVLVDHVEEPEVGGEWCGVVVQPANAATGPFDGTDVAESLGVHRDRTIDETGDHQPVSWIEEHELRVHPGR